MNSQPPRQPPLSQQISRAIVAEVVHRFYRRLPDNALLARYFAHIDDWPRHEAHISDFWWGLMGGKVAHPRPRAMEQGHRDLDFGREELDAWLSLFTQTLHDTLPESIARQWETLARQIGERMIARGMVRRGDEHGTGHRSGRK